MDTAKKQGITTGGKTKQITEEIIKLSEVKSHIESGWEFVTQLSDDEVIIRLPKS